MACWLFAMLFVHESKAGKVLLRLLPRLAFQKGSTPAFNHHSIHSARFLLCCLRVLVCQKGTPSMCSLSQLLATQCQCVARVTTDLCFNTSCTTCDLFIIIPCQQADSGSLLVSQRSYVLGEHLDMNGYIFLRVCVCVCGVSVDSTRIGAGHLGATLAPAEVVTLPECRGSFDVKWSALEGADRLLDAWSSGFGGRLAKRKIGKNTYHFLVMISKFVGLKEIRKCNEGAPAFSLPASNLFREEHVSWETTSFWEVRNRSRTWPSWV